MKLKSIVVSLLLLCLTMGITNVQAQIINQ